jgi:hypothetical protein
MSALSSAILREVNPLVSGTNLVGLGTSPPGYLEAREAAGGAGVTICARERPSSSAMRTLGSRRILQ